MNHLEIWILRKISTDNHPFYIYPLNPTKGCTQLVKAVSLVFTWFLWSAIVPLSIKKTQCIFTSITCT